MPTDQRVDEVTGIAAILLSEYRRGTPLHDLPQPGGEFDEDTTFVVEVDAEGTSLAGLVATLDAIQLAVDAAAVAFYYDQEIPGHTEELNHDFLRNLANERLVSLQILELADGTWRATLKAVFRNKVARAGVISVATLSTTALGFIFAPVAAIGGGIVGGIASVLAVNDAIQDQRKQRDQDDVNAATQRELAEVKAQLRRMEERFAAREAAPVVDPDAAREAHVRSIEVKESPRAA